MGSVRPLPSEHLARRGRIPGLVRIEKRRLGDPQPEQRDRKHEQRQLGEIARNAGTPDHSGPGSGWKIVPDQTAALNRTSLMNVRSSIRNLRSSIRNHFRARKRAGLGNAIAGGSVDRVTDRGPWARS